MNNCRAVWSEAEKGDVLIYTSFFTFAEVFKAKCEGTAKPLAEEQDQNIEKLLRQKFIRPVVVDERIGVTARRLMRHHPECKKPSDGVHLATALVLNVDEMHTYDGSDLLRLSGLVHKANGQALRICPPSPSQAPLPSPPKAQTEMFEDQGE